MTDQFDALKSALRAAPPAVDADARAIAVRRAMGNFDRLQETRPAPRPTPDRPRQVRVMTGVRIMLDQLTRRPLLATSTSLAALCLGLVVVLPLQDTSPIVRTGPALQEAPNLLGEAAPVHAPSPSPVTGKRAVTDREAAPALSVLAEDASAVGNAVPESAVELALQATENTEYFSKAPANPVMVTATDPVSTFSVDVDTASYAIVRSSLTGGFLPDPSSVRVEEMINYFPYDLPAPEAGEAPFRPTVSVMPTPWNSETRLVHIALQGRLPAIADRPPLNLVFLIDTSGSMEDANKLPLLKQSLRLALGQLRPQDQVAIVAYAGSAGTVLEPTAASERDTIAAALDRLSAGGSTAGAEGLELAYRLAERMAGAGEVSRVLLATDGDFNVGVSDPQGLESYISRKRDSGVYLSVLGFGRGNLNDATMQALAQAGNGTAAYVDTLSEARKVLVDQLTGTLFPIADDVKIQVEWNPAAVAEYRLIGYETRALRREDFGNDAVDAGEIGAGHSMTAIYEITPPGSPALRNDPLRYGLAAADDPAPVSELGFLRLRYKAPGESVSALIETPIPVDTPPASEDARFAAAIAGFGQLLAGSVYTGTWNWDAAIALASGARGTDPFGYRSEAITLMRLAQALSAN